MIFSMDVRRARKGDCFMVHFGSKQNRGLIVVDGGPSSVYQPHLKPRLGKIREKVNAEKNADEDTPLMVDLLMISHVDDDHIKGILDLTKEEIEAQDSQQPQLLNVLDLWHNSFSELIDDDPEELLSAFRDHFGAAALSGAGLSDDREKQVEDKSEEPSEVVRSTMAVLANVEQGFQLRRDAEKLGWPRNAEFDGNLVMAKENDGAVDFGKGLKLTVIGPMQPELKKLHADHVKWLKKLEDEGLSPPAALAAYVDKSPANLSSIVVLAEANQKKMLLTGDARGDKVLEGLEMMDCIKPGKKLEVDVLKVPHHGSANNLDDDFFERIVAKHYVFSGNGQHGNPERESLEMLFRARGGAPFTVHLTYPIDEIDVERKKDWQKEQANEKKRKLTNPNAKVRKNWSKSKNGLVAFFDGLQLAAGQKIKIVDKSSPHIIDLLDPVGL